MRPRTRSHGSDRPESPRAWPLAVLAAWTIFGALGTVQVYHMRTGTGVPTTWGDALSIAAFDAVMWAIIHVLVIAFVWRYAPERSRWVPTLLILLALGLGAVLLRSIAESAYGHWADALRPRSVGWLLIAYLPSHLLVVSALAGSTYAIKYFLRLRQREMHLAQNEALLSQAQLSALKMQLQPHFLFNTLNAIAALVRRDGATAERMIEHLSSMLRTNLAYGNVHEVTLDEELELLEPYVAIEQARFGDRLTFVEAIDPGVHDAIVPHLILQPLVENALRHGIGARPGPGRVVVRAEDVGGVLLLEVSDDGRRLAPDWIPPDDGVGLRNIRSRLNELYPDRHDLDVRSRAECGVSVTIKLPLEHAPEPIRTHGNGKAARNHRR